MQVALVGAQVDGRFVIARRLSGLGAKSLQVRALSGFDQTGEHLGDALSNAFDRCELVGLVQRLEVGPLQRKSPRGRGEGPGAIDLLGVLPEEIADLRQDLRGGDRIHPSIV